MKGKTKFSTLIIILLFCFCFAIGISFSQNLIAPSTEAQSFERESALGIENYTGYGCDGINHVPVTEQTYKTNYDLEALDGLGCSTSHCGLGKESGYSATYSTNGCRNWQVMPFYLPFYKYYIDTSTMEGLTPSQQDIFIQNIRRAASVWNSTYMHDGSGQLVELIETEPTPLVLLGLDICPIRYNPSLGGGLLGEFIPVPYDYHIDIKYYSGFETILHEFGHLLGLQDLDMNNSPFVHSVLMGYDRGGSGLHYQDIQGLAVANAKHTDHEFSRYYVDGDSYKHVCFYCDVTDTRNSPISGSLALEEAANCVHDYQPMVSAGEKHWLKCKKCYKVVESSFIAKGITSSTLEIVGDLNNTTSNVVIPSIIGGQTVVKIGDSAFENSLHTSITLPSTVTSIGNNAFKNSVNLTDVFGLTNVQSIGTEAFKGCTLLSNISIPAGLSTIGTEAFSGCFNLNINVATSNPNYSSLDNVLYNKSKTNLIAAGKISSEFSVPNSVQIISPHAFERNNNLYVVRFYHNPTIGDSAFANCEYLNSVYFYTFDTPSLGENSFSDNDFVLFAPYDVQNDYRNAFSSYTSSINSEKINIYFVSDGATLETIEVDYGSTISNLLVPTKTGYSFDGWYLTETYEGQKYQNGQKWDCVQDSILYAKWVPQVYNVSLDANGGVLNGENTFSVTYGASFGSTALVTRTGYTFDGWYDISGVRYMTENGESVRLWDKPVDTTLYAHWSIKSYQIVINNNGTITWLGANGLSNESCSIEYGTVIDAINLISIFKQSDQGFKEGKIFDHFEYNGTNFNWTTVPDLGASGTIVMIYPIWISEVHTIYFNTLCSIVFDKIEENFDSTIQLPSNVNRAGCSFKGWYTQPEGGTKVAWTKMPDLTPNSQNNGSITLFAQYDFTTYLITYNLDGGTNNSGNPSSYNVNSDITFLTPTKYGYSFEGWYSNAAKTTRIYGLKNDTGNKTIYAKWTALKFTISLNSQGGTGGTSSVTVTFGQSMPSASAPTKSGFAFGGYYTGSNGSGTQYYNENMSSVRTWNMTGSQTLYAYWIGTYNVIVRYVLTNPGAQTTSTMFKLRGEDAPVTLLCNRSFSFTVPTTYENATFTTFLVTDDVSFFGFKEISTSYFSKSGTTVTFNANNNGLQGKTIYAVAYYEEPQSCVAEGTLITLADGTQKAVETLTGNELLLVWNLYTGQFDVAPILFIDSDPATFYKTINLSFSDGTQVKVISEHAFWNFNLNQYVFLREDASQYIGHWFNKQTTDANGNLIWTKVQLTNVIVTEEYTTAWSPVTYSHLCIYVNGMLSMPGATEGLINIFEVDEETMCIDQEQFLADIEQYGLFTYEEFAEIYPVPEEIFDAFNGQYLKISIGKGLITYERLGELIEHYSEFFV